MRLLRRSPCGGRDARTYETFRQWRRWHRHCLSNQFDRWYYRNQWRLAHVLRRADHHARFKAREPVQRENTNHLKRHKPWRLSPTAIASCLDCSPIGRRSLSSRDDGGKALRAHNDCLPIFPNSPRLKGDQKHDQHTRGGSGDARR